MHNFLCKLSNHKKIDNTNMRSPLLSDSGDFFSFENNFKYFNRNNDFKYPNDEYSEEELFEMFSEFLDSLFFNTLGD